MRQCFNKLKTKQCFRNSLEKILIANISTKRPNNPHTIHYIKSMCHLYSTWTINKITKNCSIQNCLSNYISPPLFPYDCIVKCLFVMFFFFFLFFFFIRGRQTIRRVWFLRTIQILFFEPLKNTYSFIHQMNDRDRVDSWIGKGENKQFCTDIICSMCFHFKS